MKRIVLTPLHLAEFRQVPADHEHEWAPNPLGGDYTCLICNIAASDSWEIVRSEEVHNA